MTMVFSIGQRVRIYPSGKTGKVHSIAKQSAWTIGRAYSDRDRTPYTIELDQGGFVHAIGDDLVKISDPN